jgi:SNF2 family DNA or RNA helicase
MGLGKSIQTIALLNTLYENLDRNPEVAYPTVRKKKKKKKKHKYDTKKCEFLGKKSTYFSSTYNTVELDE